MALRKLAHSLYDIRWKIARFQIWVRPWDFPTQEHMAVEIRIRIIGVCRKAQREVALHKLVNVFRQNTKLMFFVKHQEMLKFSAPLRTRLPGIACRGK